MLEFLRDLELYNLTITSEELLLSSQHDFTQLQKRIVEASDDNNDTVVLHYPTYILPFMLDCTF